MIKILEIKKFLKKLKNKYIKLNPIIEKAIKKKFLQIFDKKKKIFRDLL